MATSIEAYVRLDVISTVLLLGVCWCQNSSYFMYLDPISPVYEGERLIVTCNFFLLIKQKKNLKWTLNGTIANKIDMDIDMNFQLVRAEKKGHMTMPNISINLNNTVVACAADSPDNGEEISSNTSTIYVEGSPVAVNDLKMDVLQNLFFITWKAPFTFFRQSITYCVEIVTQVSRHSLVAECGLRIPSVTYDKVDYLTLYEAIVISRNKIGNGTSSSVFPSLPGIIDDCNASTIRGTYLVQVECHFNGTVIGGILILLLHNDPKESGERGKIIGKNIIRKSDTSVVINGRVHGSYYFTIHPVLKKLGILGSRIPFGQRINIPKLETSVLDISTAPILSTVGTTSIALQLTTKETTPHKTYPVTTATVTTSYPTTFTATTSSIIMGVGSFTVGLIPGLILGVLCGYKLFNKKRHTLPETQQLAPSPNVALLTYSDHNQPPPKLPPLSADHSKLPITTLPPIRQPLPPINTDTIATNVLPPLIDRPDQLVQFPSKLPPLNIKLPPLHSTNRINTSYPSLNYHKTIPSEIQNPVKRKKRKHTSHHQKNAVAPQEYTEEQNSQVVVQISKKKSPRKIKKVDVEKQIDKSDEVSMHYSKNGTMSQQVSSRDENSHVHSTNVGHSGPHKDSKESVVKNKAELADNSSNAIQNCYKHPDKVNTVQHDQEMAHHVDQEQLDDMSTKDNKTETTSYKLEKIAISSSRSQEMRTPQTSTVKLSFSDQEMEVEVPLTDTIWPQTLD